VFELYSEVAQLVASEIEAVITPEEQERIEKIPTSSTTAFDLFRKSFDVSSNEEAIELLKYALEYDSTFAWPYVALGYRFMHIYEFNPETNADYLDSAVMMVGKAFHFDPQLAEAHSLKGYTLRLQGELEGALTSFDRALELNPNEAGAYNGKGWIYFGEMDYVNALDNFYQNSLRDRTPLNLADVYESIGFVLANVGMKETAVQYFEKSLQYTGDSSWYYIKKTQTEFYAGEYTEAIKTANQNYGKELLAGAVERGKHTYGMAVLGESYMFANQYSDAYTYLNYYVELGDSIGWSFPWHKMDIAFIFLMNGNEERALELIDQQIRQSEQWIAESHNYINDELLHLAMAYMLKQDRGKTLMYLNQLSQKERLNAIAAMVPANPIFSPLKDDPEFMEICDRIRVRYQAEQERVRKWLEENEIPDRGTDL
ncbi:MAG: tetratricopeptide repeat protein, partial [Bacteroidales bacterium]